MQQFVAKSLQPFGKIGREINHHVVVGRLHPLAALIVDRNMGSVAGNSSRPLAIDLQQVRIDVLVEPLRSEMIVVDQRRQAGHVGPAHDQHPAGMLLHELRDLHEAHAQQRVEQQRQHRDHEQRAPIAQLVANFAEAESV